MPKVKNGDIDVHYEVRGKGDPLVLLLWKLQRLPTTSFMTS
jgi:hypothetical protein